MSRKTIYALLFAALSCGLWLAAAVARAQEGQEKGVDDVSTRSQGRVRAPELEGGRGWLNTDRPLSIAALRGKVVLLDFWTYGCVNCMHVIPDLRRLEEKYAKELVVIGVHSAKFENEKETENIRRIILRYGIEHPVVNDADFRIWHAYAVNAWPTLVVIDPAGYVVGEAAGEGNYEVLDKVIGQLVEDARKRGALDERPLKLALERAKVGDLPLAFPGKILADERGERLFIADSNHNRIVVTRLDGTLLEVIGSGEHGARDGAFKEASFYRPQGLALDGESLYVADTENHLVRRVDLKTRTVETIAGTGKQLLDLSVRGGPARSTPISSPWDLALVGRALYIAMAGPHQIWRLDLDRQQLSVFAGTGREAREDGPRDEAGFAQPSGLATDGKTLYVADAESNTIRAVSLDGTQRGETKAGDANADDATRGDSKTGGVIRDDSPAGESDARDAKADGVRLRKASLSSSVSGDEVQTLAGGDLFDFGDRDGEGDDVRLQHPLGLALHEGHLFIADTYNHKIKVLDPRARTVKTFAGTGKSGQTDGAGASFYEPGGLTVARGKLYVADTDNHAVRVVDLASKQTTTLVIRGLEPPARPASVSVSADAPGESDSAGPNAEEFKAAPQRLAVGGDAALVLDASLPAGYHLNPSAPHRYLVSVEGGQGTLALVGSSGEGSPTMKRGGGKELRLPFRIPLRALAPGASELRVRLTLYYCREDNTGTCKVKTLVWRAPVEVTNEVGAAREIKLQGKVE
ncbi:MAG: redoxin domain-containing protein [Acidobacteriota bacterium]|nr:redoxin domain-containing protein [Acidobacteriota bacterium]MDQ5836017.1 redoxin domain-containing protein [Acidobacteriota bacterium]